MRGGRDQGFCLSYSKLSYRRKFIRTIWTFLIGTLVCAVILFTRPVLRQEPQYIVAGASLLFLLFVAQAAYNYSKWQSEHHDNQQT